MRHRQNKHILNTKKLNIRQLNKKHINTKLSNIKSSNIKSSNIKSSSIKLKKHKSLKKHQKGGKAISSGSYGCIFHPPLKCDETDKNAKIVDDTYISKLMYKDYAETEMNEISIIRDLIDNKKLNIEKYCLIKDTIQCKPVKLTVEDLIDFDKNCKNCFNSFNSSNINSSNINSKIDADKLRIIQMKHGGMELYYYISSFYSLSRNNNITYDSFIKIFNRLNELLIELLTNVITKLIEHNYSHNDIKSSNILINTNIEPFLLMPNPSIDGRSVGINPSEQSPTTSTTKKTAIISEHVSEPVSEPISEHNINPISIIDWGIGYLHDTEKLPEYFINNDDKFCFNLPYSILLFNNSLNTAINNTLLSNNQKHTLTLADTLPIYTNALITDIKSNPNQHETYVIISNRIKNNNICETEINTIFNEIMYSDYDEEVTTYVDNKLETYFNKVLEKYYDNTNKTFNKQTYLNEVFVKNADIWGLLTIYDNLLDMLKYNIKAQKIRNKDNQYNKINIDTLTELTVRLSNILYNYIISDTYAAQPIDIPELIEKLKTLSII